MLDRIVKNSASSMKTYDQCKRKFYYTYIKKLPRKEWGHLQLGTLCHSVLEIFHKDYKKGDDLAPLMSKSFAIARKQSSGKMDDTLLSEAKEILQKYVYKMEEGGMPKNVVGLEKRFSYKIKEFQITGIIDRIDKVGNKYYIYDYKTSKSTKYMDDFQLSVYALWFFKQFKKQDLVKTGYIMLRHNFDILSFDFTRDNLEPKEEKIIKYCESIKGENTWEASPGPLCRYCDFYHELGGPCTAAKDISDGWAVNI